MIRHSFRYDAFISHAVEDKIGIATELTQKLQDSGLKVWYSGAHLEFAGSLNDSIQEGMRSSRFGVVIFSPNYLQKHWTMQECYHFWERDGKGKPPVVVLPVYYHTTAEEVSKRILLLGDRFSINADQGVDAVAAKITAYITRETIRVRTVKRWTFGILVLTLAMMVLGGVYLSKHLRRGLPDAEVIESLVSTRIEKIDNHKSATNGLLSTSIAVPTSYIDSVYNAFKNAKSYYRNEYEFNNGFGEVKARKNVNALLHLQLQDLNPGNHYMLDSISIVQLENQPGKIVYRVKNLAPVISTILPISEKEDFFAFDVHYKNNIRSIEVTLYFPKNRNDTKRHKMVLTGFKPSETYEAIKVNNEWQLREIQTAVSERKMQRSETPFP